MHICRGLVKSKPSANIPAPDERFQLEIPPAGANKMEVSERMWVTHQRITSLNI